MGPSYRHRKHLFTELIPLASIYHVFLVVCEVPETTKLEGCEDPRTCFLVLESPLVLSVAAMWLLNTNFVPDAALSTFHYENIHLNL